MNRICLVVHSLGFGGLERVMSTLANYFHEQNGTEVHVVLIGRQRLVQYDLEVGIHIHKPTFVFKNSSRTYNTLRTIYFLRKKIKEIDPSSVLSFGEYWNNLVLLSSLGLRMRIFISDRSQPNKDLGKFHNLLRKLLYPLATGFIAQTSISERIAKQNKWNQNIRVIPNPIREITNEHNLERRNFILSVSRFIPSKNIDQLINIFAELKLEDWSLLIVGGNSKGMNLVEEYKGLVRNLNMQDKIKLIGFTDEVDKYYLQSKIFAFTSSSEGFPNVIGEAMNSGLPVIAYDCVAGPSDMIENEKNGFLIPLFDQEMFKSKLNELITDEKLRNDFGICAAESMERFSINVVSDQYFEFLTSHENSN